MKNIDIKKTQDVPTFNWLYQEFFAEDDFLLGEVSEPVSNTWEDENE